MTDVISSFNLTLPANGSPSSISFVDCELGWSNVEKILLLWPPGCADLVNLRVEHGGGQVYPQQPGTFFSFDDYQLEIEVTGQGNAGQWHVAGYNTDYFQHTIQAHFFWNYLPVGATMLTSTLASL